MITTTLKALRSNEACISGYNRVVRALQGLEFTEADRERESYIHFANKDPIQISFIIQSNGLDDALWALRACEQTPDLQRACRLFAVWCARQVEHLMEDQRSRDALNTAECFANDEATGEELATARAAARTAAWDAARAAAWDAARTAAMAAAMAAARAAAWDAARAAAWDAARAAAWDAAWDAQAEMFNAVFCGERINIGVMYAQ